MHTDIKCQWFILLIACPKQTKTQRKQNTQPTHKFHERIKNLSNIPFNTEETKILELGLNCAFNKPVQQFLQDLVIDTKNAIRKLNMNRGKETIDIVCLCAFVGINCSIKIGAVKPKRSEKILSNGHSGNTFQ
jgi:hypothetical protein